MDDIKKLEEVIAAMIPSARLVWENGGYSGSSGNFPLVEAYDKLESLKTIAPEIYALITARK